MPTSIAGHHASDHTENKSPEMTTIVPSQHAGTPVTQGDRIASAPLDVKREKSAIDKQTLDYAVRSGIAGGLAGCSAKTVVAPLDRVKILFQASNPEFQKYTGSWFGVGRAMRDIYATDGAWGLFRGHSATLLRIFPYAGIKFLAYEQFRALLIHDKTQETPGRRFLSGSAAGMSSVFLTYPLEVVRVRMAFETKAHARVSFAQICRVIYHEQPPRVSTATQTDTSTAARAVATGLSKTAGTLNEITPSSGFSNFFRGFTPTLWGMLPYAGCSFLTHDTAGDLMRRPSIAQYTTIPISQTPSRDPNKPPQLRYWAELATGGFAGLVSQTVSYPLEVIRRRMQVGGVVGDRHRLGMFEVAGNIWRNTGYKGFFIGLSIGYVKVIPMTAVSFYVYERGKLMLGI